MKKLTSSDKKRITSDWIGQFNEFSVYKPMWLMRRGGLFVQGILLDKDSTNTNYLPTEHLYNLARVEVDTIKLSVPAELKSRKGVVSRIGIVRHEDEFETIVKDFVSQAPLPMFGALRYEQVMGTYNRFLKSGMAHTKYPYHEWYDMGCLMIWCNQMKEAGKLAIMYEKEIMNWPDSLMKYQGDRVWEKLEWLKRWLESRDDLQAVVNRNISLLKLEAIPDVGLTCPC
jgi:hypothetical protein